MAATIVSPFAAAKNPKVEICHIVASTVWDPTRNIMFGRIISVSEKNVGRHEYHYDSQEFDILTEDLRVILEDEGISLPNANCIIPL